MDGRFTAKIKTKPPSKNRVLVYEFLEEIWNTLSEPMPEATEPGVLGQLKFRRLRGRRPKLASKQERMAKSQKKELRLLPPGTFTD